MNVIRLQDRETIERFLWGSPELYVYALGDLDDFFWPFTTWYGHQEAGELRDIVLVYSGKALPTVIAQTAHPAGMRTLLAKIGPQLPRRFHAHLSVGVEEVFRNGYTVDPHGVFYRMALRNAGRAKGVECPDVAPLELADMEETLAFYEESYPGNWFDERMLETGRYYALRADGRLASIAGVHVCSRRYRVAALGNIATHPAHRRKGYGTRVTARLCQTLLGEVDHIGLNVKADNEVAMRCYQRLGFEIIAPYGEFNIERKT